MFTEYKCGGKDNELRGNIGFPYEEGKPSNLRTWNMHDVDQIIYSDEFRDLQDKIQLLPREHPRNRTRLMHTLEVVRIAKEMAISLGLNVDLTEAIALGHDLGNSALGRAGNDVVLQKLRVHHQDVSRWITELLSGRYAHPAMVGDKLKGDEKYTYIQDPNSGITYLAASICDCEVEFAIQPEVLDGIGQHSDGQFPMTLEGQIVRHADNFAYIVQDIADAFKAGIITQDFYESFGKSNPIPEQSWDNINSMPKIPAAPHLKHLYDRSTGVRVATLVCRFVEYHKQKKESGEDYETISSEFVEKGHVPKLELDPGMKLAVDSVWAFITEHIHTNRIISSTQALYQQYMEQVIEMIEKDWEIYDDFNPIIDECVRKQHHEKNIFETLCYHPKLTELSHQARIALVVNRFTCTGIIDLVHNYNKMGVIKKVHL